MLRAKFLLYNRVGKILILARKKPKGVRGVAYMFWLVNTQQPKDNDFIEYNISNL